MAKVSKNPGNFLYPLPPCLITCGPAEAPNIITLAWVGHLCSEPPVVGVSIRPSRHSYGLVKGSGEFVVNVPTAAMVRAVDACGTVSGRDVDKFTTVGLTPAAAQVVRTVLIQECPVNIECQTVQVVPLGSHDLFLGKVVAVQVDEALLDERGELDLARAEALAYGGRAYWTVGPRLERQAFTAPR
jgi:flavin reductase (DIM6/NTAB) family NADH-FMN oxidoreductase RutF